MCSLPIDRPMAPISPKNIKLGEIWRLVSEKTGDFPLEIWIGVTFWRFSLNKQRLFCARGSQSC